MVLFAVFVTTFSQFNFEQCISIFLLMCFILCVRELKVMKIKVPTTLTPKSLNVHHTALTPVPIQKVNYLYSLLMHSLERKGRFVKL